MAHVLNIRAFRVGGIRFLRIGCFQLSFCQTRKPFVRNDVDSIVSRELQHVPFPAHVITN